ncbi:MAG: PAS domain S-box protein, partial [Candidatus Thiodiazotropha lotti]
ARERRLATVVRDSNDAITVQDLHGNIQAWNPAAERLYGYTEQEALDLNIKQLVPDTGQSDLISMLEDISEGEKFRPMQLERITKSGEVVQIWLIATALMDDEGKPNALSTIERVAH